MALRASIFHIETAMDGKMAFMKAANPFWSAEDDGESKKKNGPPVKEDGELDRDAIAENLRKTFGVPKSLNKKSA